MKLEMGEWYQVTGKLYRHSKHDLSYGYRKVWELEDHDVTRKAMYIGKRTLSNGVNEHCGYEGITYTQKESFTARAFVESERGAPFFVLDENIKELSNERTTINQNN